MMTSAGRWWHAGVVTDSLPRRRFRFPDAPRAILAADAAGCVVAAGVAVFAPAVTREVDPSGRAHRPIIAALLTTAAVCGTGAAAPSRALLTAAAVTNAGWVAAGLIALTRKGTGRRAALIGATVVLDAVAGGVQGALSRSAPR